MQGKQVHVWGAERFRRIEGRARDGRRRRDQRRDGILVHQTDRRPPAGSERHCLRFRRRRDAVIVEREPLAVVRRLVHDGVKYCVGTEKRLGSGFGAAVFNQREHGGQLVFAGLEGGLEERQSWREVVRVLPPLLHVSSKMWGHFLNLIVLSTDHKNEIRRERLNLLRHATRNLLAARLAPQRGRRGDCDGLFDDGGEGLLRGRPDE